MKSTNTLKNSTIGMDRRAFLGSMGLAASLAGTSVVAAGQNAPGGVTAPITETTTLMIGWASVSITPDAPVQLAGQFAERVSQTVLDPCMATALVLQGKNADGTEDAVILVSCDVVNIGREQVEDVRRRVAEVAAEVEVSKIILTATHTHTAPTLATGAYKDPDPGVFGPAEYQPFFCERVAEAIIQAWYARRPGGVSRAVGHAAVGFNRIMVYADGTTRMYGSTNDPDWRRPEAGNDHGLELLFTWDTHKQLTGILINIACPSQVVEGQLYVSADFWGPVREMLRSQFTPDLQVFGMTGAAGDQSPRDLVRRGRNEPDMRSEPGMREMALRIVNGVMHAMETVQSDTLWSPEIRHHTAPLELPARKVTDEEGAAAEAEEARLLAGGEIVPGSRDAAMLRRAHNVLTRYREQGDNPLFEMELHVIRLGDIAIATNPFELYLNYGLQIKARSRAEQTFIAQLSNDRGRYLPTAEAVGAGAYGSNIEDNNVGPEGGAALVEATLATLNGMWPA